MDFAVRTQIQFTLQVEPIVDGTLVVQRPQIDFCGADFVVFHRIFVVHSDVKNVLADEMIAANETNDRPMRNNDGKSYKKNVWFHWGFFALLFVFVF